MLEVKKSFVLAVKSAPEEKIFSDIKKAGLEAVELYISSSIMKKIKDVVRICKAYAFRYAVHAPNDHYDPESLKSLVKEIRAEVIVFHNIYWDDEWEGMIDSFKDVKSRLCVENTFSVHEPLKFMRRYNLGRCLDLEHLQMEASGFFEEEFIKVIKQADHIHLTGFKYGTQLWHTHIHHSPKHSEYILDLLKESGYRGFIVSEAKTKFQTYEEFKKLDSFYKKWQRKVKLLKN